MITIVCLTPNHDIVLYTQSHTKVNKTFSKSTRKFNPQNYNLVILGNLNCLSLSNETSVNKERSGREVFSSFITEWFFWRGVVDNVSLAFSSEGGKT